MTDDLFAALRLAISDPGSVLPREYVPLAGWDSRRELESVPNWQARAVMVKIVPMLAAAENGMLAQMKLALELIGPECQNYTTGIGSCWNSGRMPDAKYGASRWCDGCIAAKGLGMERA